MAWRGEDLEWISQAARVLNRRWQPFNIVGLGCTLHTLKAIAMIVGVGSKFLRLFTASYYGSKEIEEHRVMRD